MSQASVEHYGHASTIAIEALKSLLLVNGGAATALIALNSKASSGRDYGLSVLLFGCAALLNAFTLVIGYFSQLAYANHVLATEKGDVPNATSEIGKHSRRQKTAITVLAISLLASAGGMAFAFYAVQKA